MAVAVRSAASQVATASQTTLAVPVPAGVANGDLLVMAVYLTASSGSITDPAGWTPIYSNIVAGSSASSRASAWYRVASSEPASYTITTGSGRSSGAMVALTGANTGSPIDVSANAPNVTAGLSIVAPTVSPAAAGMLVTIVGGRLQPNATAATFAPAGGQTEAVEASSAVAATSNSGIEVATESVAAGATGTRTATASVVTSVDWIAFSVVIKPAAGGGSVALVGSGADGTSTADAGTLQRARPLVASGATGDSTADSTGMQRARPLVASGADGLATADGVLTKAGPVKALAGSADGDSTAAGVASVGHSVALVGSGAGGDSTADASGMVKVHAWPLVGSGATGDSDAAAVMSGGRPIGVTVERLPIDGIALDIFANEPGYARWGIAVWDGAVWASETWVETTCLVTSAKWAWGANRALGVLSVASGGPFLATTYDPDRQLDPANTQSPFVGSARPGTLVRLRYYATVIAWATLDELGYSQQAQEGRMQGFDAVGALLNAEVPVITSPPTTLRAFARAYLALTPWATRFTVEADPPEGDTPIGTYVTAPTGLVTAWEAIQMACQDALAFGWIGADLVIRFRSHGDPVDNGLVLGLEGIPTGELVTQSNRDGIINRVVAKETGGAVLTDDDVESQGRFGLKVLDRSTRNITGAAAWADRVLADRAFASLEYYPAAIVPITSDQLLAIVATGGINVVHIRLDVPEPDVSVDVRSVGWQMEASPAGWVAVLVGYVSAVEWDAGVTPPPPDPNPTPPATQTITRTFVSDKATRVSKTDTGAKYGAGTQTEIPIGYHSGWIDRMLVQFDIDWSNVVEVVSATLRVRTSTQVFTGFGSSPRVRIQRATESWPEGSASSPSGSNATVYPGPSTTATGEVTPSITRSEGAQEDINVLAIVKAWAPASAGGSGQPNRGFVIKGYSESDSSRTTEFRSDDYATSSHRPTLIIQVKIPA